MRKILVDADACPVKSIIVDLARTNSIPVVMFIDVNHELNDGYSEVVIVDQGRDSVDFKLISRINPNDIVVTQDYGVAAIALSKKANVINQNGFLYTSNNIDTLLNARYQGQKDRRMGKRTSGPPKRNSADNEKFLNEFRKLL